MKTNAKPGPDVSVKPGLRSKKTDQAMRLFGRTEGHRLFLSLDFIAQALKRATNEVESTTAKLIASDKVVVFRNHSDEKIFACRIPEILRYKSSELIETLSDQSFNKVGKWLFGQLSASSADPLKLSVRNLTAFEKELALPSQFIFYFISCFVEYGLVRVDKKSRELSLAPGQKDLSASSLRNVVSVRSVKSHAHKEERSAPGDQDMFRHLGSLYAAHDTETQMQTIAIEADGVFKTHHICEINLGHQDTDLKNLEATVVGLESMTRSNRPSVIIIGGLIQGTFQHVQKNRRNTLVRGLKSEGRQLEVAKSLLKRISRLGVKTVLNLSSADRLRCENGVGFMMQAIENYDNPTSDDQKSSLHFMQLDRMKATKLWDNIFEFYWYVALEYQFRCGRRFYSADEVWKKTNGRIGMEESILLLEAYRKLREGKPLTDRYSVIEVANIPLPGKVFDDFTVVDDCRFAVRIKDGSTGQERRISMMEKHFFRLTSTSMVADPTAAVRSIMAQLNSMDAEKPDVVFIEREHMPFLWLTDHTLVVSLPGMQKSNINRASLHSGVSGDPSHRILTTRKEVFGGGTMPLSFYPDGSFEVSLRDNYYMDKSTISSDRIAIPFFVDWQTGSVTASSDLQAIFMDWCLHHILPYHPTWFFYGGDHIQGFNYQHHAIESQRMGLVSADSQKEFVQGMISYALSGVPKKNLVHNLKGVRIIPGNHEWNSGSKWPGVIHCEMVRNAFDGAFGRAGVPVIALPNETQDLRVKICDSARDDAGNHYKVWAFHEDIGGYGFRCQHMIVERGAKGQGGPPIYALKSQLNGNSESMRGVDIMATGHWHSPMLWKLGNTTTMISGSLAGTSGYEYLRGLHATVGCSVIFLGGGLPPTIRFLNAESLARYEPQGFYSKKNLAEIGFRDDPGFDRLKHGFARFAGQPQSAVQKFLWATIDRYNWDPGTVLGSSSK